MAAYLNDFQHDIFVSYGWAGTEDPQRGDRGWVNRFHDELTTEMRARLNGQCEVYFDLDAQRNGYLYRNLEDALENSGLLLFVVSPGSCKKESWCRYELQHFLDQVRPIAYPGLRRDKRIFCMVLRDVGRDEQPEPLPLIVPYSFFDSRFNAPLPVDDFRNKDTPAYLSFYKLCLDLEKSLKLAKQQQEKSKTFSGRYVFMGAVPQELREHRDLLRNSLEDAGHQVLQASPIPGLAQDDFDRRTQQAIAKASDCLLLFGTPKIHKPATEQCRAALDLERKVYMWRNREVQFEPEHEEFLKKIKEVYLKTGLVEELRQGGIAYLDSNLRFDLEAGKAPPLPVSLPTGHATRIVMLQFNQDDREGIQVVVDRLRSKGIEIQPPFFTGTRRQREEVHSRFYREADAILVFFGRQDLWTFNTCSTVSNTLAEGRMEKPAAVLLAPPPKEPPSKPLFRFPPFEVINCQHGSWDRELDQWADRVLARD